jgi:hypothetical protein
MGFAEFIIGRASRAPLAHPILRLLAGGGRSVAICHLAKFPSSSDGTSSILALYRFIRRGKPCWSNAV